GYTAENVVVGVAGKIDPKIVKKEIEKHFSKIRTGKRPIAKKMVEKQKEPQMFFKEKKTDQTQLVVGVRTFDMFHKDRYVLSVLGTILGSGMSSRLFIEVRERRGLAYSVHTDVEYYTDAGYLATQAGVEHENLEKALEVILAEYKKLTTELVSKEELKKAKDHIKGKMALAFEGSDDIVGYLTTQETLRHEILLPKEAAKKIDAVTAEDIQRLAKSIFQDKKLNMAIISPKVNQKKLQNLLHL
ncbi:MAG: pitrilysin family protein, partial [Patescibacteria group bacterium]